MRRIAVALSALAGVCAAGALALFIGGWRLLTISTPSMATTAPVGSLVVSRPGSCHVGDVCAFRVHELIYTHRVVGLDGADLVTKGDLNASNDSWRVAPGDVIGHAAAIVPGGGWLLKALPFLLVAALVVWASTRNADRQWRAAWRIVGFSAAVSLTGLWLRPWAAFQTLGYAPTGTSSMSVRLVNTGLFPLQAQGTRLVMGQAGTVVIPEQDSRGWWVLNPSVSLTWWQLALVVLACLSPLIVAIVLDRRLAGSDAVTSPATGSASPATTPGPEPWWRVALVIGAATALVIAVLSAGGLAGLTASVRNLNDVAATRTFFTCRQAETGTTSAWGAWALTGTAAYGALETDLTGHGHTATWYGAGATSTSYGCVRDTPLTTQTFSGHGTCLWSSWESNPQVFSVEFWFRTTTAGTGRFVGFDDQVMTSAHRDRLVYLDPAGRVVFGVYSGGTKIVASPAGHTYADGQWHQVVVSLSGAGQRIYLDGALAQANPAVTSAHVHDGYWGMGCGLGSGWATAAQGSGSVGYNIPYYYAGQMQYVAVYTSALTPTQIYDHYLSGRP